MRTKTGSVLAIALLAVTTLIFTSISLRFLVSPVASATPQGIVLRNGFAITTVRVGFGVFPLACGAVTAFALLSPARRRGGLWFITATFTIALAVRMGSVILDHAAGATNTRMIAIEAVILAISVRALLGDQMLSKRIY